MKEGRPIMARNLLTRRQAVQSVATMAAAALAAPSVALAAARPSPVPTNGHSPTAVPNGIAAAAGCIHERIRAACRTREFVGLVARAQAVLKPEDRMAYRQDLALEVESHLVDLDVTLSEYWRHFPALASALQDIVYGACSPTAGACQARGRGEISELLETLSDRRQLGLTEESWLTFTEPADAMLDAFMEELDNARQAWCERLPGFAPALLVVQQHLQEQCLSDRGVCCSGAAEKAAA
jgi:hypothetical protein